MPINQCLKILFLILIISAALPALTPAASVRQPAVAGSFYPQDKTTLANDIKKYISAAHAVYPKQDLFSLLVPHAGYAYSGPVAGYAYALLSQQAAAIDTIIILGVNHRFAGLEHNSVYDGDFYLTPLGKVAINKEIVARLLTYPEIVFTKEAHTKEHSIEVQLPFLQTIKDFKIVPLIIGDYSRQNCQKIADILITEIINKEPKTLILTSTDFSHFHKYNEACQKDRLALKQINQLDIFAFMQAYQTKEIELCGYGPTLITMLIAQKLGYKQNTLLKYLNSGDITGDKANVVGYGALAFLKNSTYSTKNEEPKPMTSNNEYSLDDQKFLLSVARKTMTAYVTDRTVPSTKNPNQAFFEKRGAFVSLHKKGNLRGCIGYIEPVKPLLDTIIDNTINASCRDSRFPLVTPEELGDIDIEISVLSLPQKIKSYKDIVIGKHGVILEKQGYKAIFLPQVAPEQGWDVYDTLENLCYKTGLPKDAWKEGADLFVFTATVFGEKE